MSEAIASLHTDCVADVNLELADAGTKRFGAAPGAALAIPAAVRPFIEQAVRMALDVTVAALGPSFESLVKAERDNVRAVVSQNTVEFLRSLVIDLSDVKPGA